jgi:AmmeMemoRadiSam system protein B
LKVFSVYLLAAGMVCATTSCQKKEVAGGEAPSASEAPASLTIKEANVAGAFYPGDADELAAVVKARLADAEKTLDAEDIVAIIVPHAGYEYSGGVAATSYRQVEGREPATVVLLGPSHYCGKYEIATGTYGGYETPLGVAGVNGDFVAAVAEKCPDVEYTNVPFEKEHGLEVQLPFIRTLFPEARVAPFIFCRHDGAAAERFGRALAEVIETAEGDVLIVTTVDLSHYHPYDEAVRLDRAFLETFERFDGGAVFRGITDGDFEIDAPGPVAATLNCAKKLGATEAVTLEYKNSGDVTGDTSRGVVGYAAAAVIR